MAAFPSSIQSLRKRGIPYKRANAELGSFGCIKALFRYKFTIEGMGDPSELSQMLCPSTIEDNGTSGAINRCFCLKGRLAIASEPPFPSHETQKVFCNTKYCGE